MSEAGKNLGMSQDVEIPVRIPTKDLPKVNGRGEREVRVSFSVLIGFVMMLVGVGTFASNFLFATKAEVFDERVKRLEAEKSVQKDISGVQTEVLKVANKLEVHAREASDRQEVLDRNLRKLLVREGVEPEPQTKGRE